MKNRIGALVLAVVSASAGAAAQEVVVEEVMLDNGMKLLLLPRPGDPNVAAGWVAKVGSVYERPGITGVAHLFEHMMFKGTATIGTRNIEQDLQLIAELDQVKAQIRIEEAALLESHRLGRIDDPSDPALRSTEHQQLIEQFDAVLAEQSQLILVFSTDLESLRDVLRAYAHVVSVHRAGQSIGESVSQLCVPHGQTIEPRLIVQHEG